MEEDECRMVASLLEYGLKCCEVYLIPTPSADRPYTDKDILELFANIFTVLDPRCFREVLNAKMDFLFQQLCTHHNKKLPISIIPQQFLNSSRTSMSFADILLSFLTEKMDLMAGSSDVGAVMLQLFSISFRSVTDFPDNEGVLRPYMNKIVTRVMHLAKKVLEPMNYFSLLRALFRAIGGGKFEQLYKEFGPLLPELLNGLMEIQRRGPSDIRDICVELCLTVPARLSSLLPHIPLLMNAVLLAIQAQDDQVVKLGLRTIDFWVDNLNPEYLYPHMCVVLSDLMRNLCLLLSSNTTSSANAQTALSIITKTSSTPSAFGLTALTVLGKLGGRNRRFLAESFNLTAREHAGHGMLVAMRMLPRHEFVLALDDILPYTIKFLTNLKTKDSVRVDSFQFARFCLLSMIDLRGDVRTMVCSLSKEDKKTEQTFKGIAEIAVGRSDQRTASREAKRVQARLTTAAQLQVFGQLVAVIVNAGADPVLSSVDAGNSRVFALGLSRHFALHSCLPSERAPDRVFDRTEIHSALFLDALMKVLFDESTARFDMALKCLKEFVETLITMLGKQVAGTLPIVNHLLDSLSHACCENKHEHARAGSNGLFLLCQLLGASWMRSKASELLPALFGSFSSNSYELAQQTFFRSRTTISWIINSCFYQNIGESIASDVNVGDCTVKPGCSTSSNPMDADSHSTDESWFPTIMDKVIETLVMQLISTAPEARRVAQDQLKIIQHHSNQTRQVATMVRPYLERLLDFNSAHQNLSQRIAHTSAASFCLQFKDLCSTNEPALHRLLEESLAELEKPDRPNDSERHSEMPNTLPGRISYINLLTEMKVESIIFLKFALKSELFPFCSSIPVVPDIKQQFKQNIIRQWFEKLMHVSEEIFQEAKQALKGIIDEEQIPKELLQQCLRPVLLKLSDIRLLSLSLMEKLYRLVELLSSCFASTLIDKLLDHLKIFATQRVELQYGIDNEGKATIPPDDPVKVAARIISLFSPLLPSSSEFLVPLVDRALDLEKKFDENEHFRGGYLAGPSSPFRKPLMDYLNGNGMPNGNIMPKKTVEWFMQELMNPKYSQLFHSILRAPEAAPLRRYIMEEPESLITWTFDRKNQRPADIQHNYAQAALVDDSQLQGTKIVHIITSFHPEWLAQAHCNRVVDCLLEMWEAPNRREREEKNVHEARLIVECLIRYSRAFRVARSTEESFPCPVLWGMLNVFLTRSLVDYSFLEDFYKIEVAQGYSAQDKSFILRDFVSFFEDKKVVQLLKVKALNLIIIPMLEHTFKSSTSASIASESKSELAVDEINSVTDVVSDKTLDLIVKKLLGCDHSAFEENLRIELLRLFSLLIEHMYVFDVRIWVFNFATDCL
jgi:transformation/transcription domain-associated protein